MRSLGRFVRAASAFAAAASLAGFATVAQAQDKGPIRIGFLPPITSRFASPSAEMVNGFRLFWEQAGMTTSSRKIEIVTGDTTCNPDQALTQARRLVLQEKVRFMVGPLCGHEGPAVAQVSKETGVPLVMDAAGADNVTKSDRTPTVVRTAISSSQIGHPFGEYLYKELRPAQCHLHRSGSYTFGHEVTLGAIETFTGARRQGRPADLESDRHQGLRHDDQLHSCRYRRCRRDHRRRGPHPSVRGLVQLRHGQEAQDLRHLLAAGGHAAAGRRPRCRIDPNSLQYAAGIDTPENKAFVDAYAAKHKRLPSWFAESAYTAGLWTKAAIDFINGNVEDRDAFLKAMRTVSIKAPRGPLKLDAYDNPIQNVYIRQGREDKAPVLGDVLITKPSRRTRRCRSSGPGSPRNSSRAGHTSADDPWRTRRAVIAPPAFHAFQLRPHVRLHPSGDQRNFACGAAVPAGERVHADVRADARRQHGVWRVLPARRLCRLFGGARDRQLRTCHLVRRADDRRARLLRRSLPDPSDRRQSSGAGAAHRRRRLRHRRGMPRGLGRRQSARPDAVLSARIGSRCPATSTIRATASR